MELQRTIPLVILLLLSMYTILTLQKNSKIGVRRHIRRADLYKDRQFSRTSLPEGVTTLSKEQKELILNLHNGYRSIVEPPATNMRELEWDDDIEENARQHVLKCTGAHSERKMTKKFKPNDPKTWEEWYSMGENIYYAYGSQYSIEEALHMFWEEGSGYDIANNKCTHRQTCGHYQAMVNAEHTRIGCAINVCKKFSISKYPTPAIFFVCLYNAVTTIYKPYKVGKRCSDCTKKASGYNGQFCRFGLCISPAKKFKNIGFNGDIKPLGLDN